MRRIRLSSNPAGRGERGADVLEAALVLPILLTIVLGLFTFAHGWEIYQGMTRAAREGVRQAVTTNCATCGSGMDYNSNAYIRDNVVFPQLQAIGFDTTNTLLTSSYTQGYKWLNASQTVCGAYITFQYPDTISIPFIPANLGTVNLTTNVQMRLENQAVGSCP